MKPRWTPAILTALALTSVGHAAAATLEPFEEAEIFLEQNLTDDDAEIVIELQSGDDGLRRLDVIDPDGRKALRFRAGDRERLGMRKFLFESPEPGLEPILDGFPEGEYLVIGRTFSGQSLMAAVELSHQLPAGASGLFPADGDVVSADSPLTVSWDGVPGAEEYAVEVESDDAEVEIVAFVPADILSFTVPVELLFPGAEYQLGVAVRNADGNVSVVEVEFSTEE